MAEHHGGFNFLPCSGTSWVSGDVAVASLSFVADLGMYPIYRSFLHSKRLMKSFPLLAFSGVPCTWPQGLTQATFNNRDRVTRHDKRGPILYVVHLPLHEMGAWMDGWVDGMNNNQAEGQPAQYSNGDDPEPCSHHSIPQCPSSVIKDINL